MGENRLLETSDVRAYIGRLATPSLIRWRVQSDDGRDRPLQTIAWRWVAPSQKIQSQAQPQNMSKLPTIDLQAPEQDQSLYEPEYAGLLAGEENSHKFWSSKEEKLSLAPLHRPHRVFAWFRYLRESFNIDKQDRFAASPSQGLGTGLAAQYYILSQLSVSGSLETHATQTEYETGGTSEPAQVQKRVRSHLALGLDLLNTNSREPNWAFNLGPVGSFLQLPLVSDNQRVLDYGIKASLQVFQPALNLDLLILKSGSRETSLVGILPWPVFSLRPFLGFYRFDTRQSSGAFTGLYLETGLRLGIERDF
ncbi:MAG: hypothetical protein NTX25_13915 [Proteobacteria bacterium]|nr:hypothetical protein [Pseudomonadota bacterium]